MPSRGPLGVALALAASLGAGCATGRHPGQLLGLQSAEQAALADCRAAIHAKRCGARAGDAACWDEVVAAYDALPDVAARKRFLVEAGCPSPTVEVWLPDAR